MTDSPSIRRTCGGLPQSWYERAQRRVKVSAGVSLPRHDVVRQIREKQAMSSTNRAGERLRRNLARESAGCWLRGRTRPGVRDSAASSGRITPVFKVRDPC